MQQSVEKLSSAPNRRSVGNELEHKIHDHTAKVGVIGLGYVGLPLAIEMAKVEFEVTGIDIDWVKVDSVNAGISYDEAVERAEIKDFHFTISATALHQD
jgi:UDP-N-acetyl-D-glucosamine dehydrogenase